MKKIVLTTIILLSMSFGAYAQQYRANGTGGWSLRLFFDEQQNEEEMGMGLFDDNRETWEEEMDFNMDFFNFNDGMGGGLFGRGNTPTGVGSGFRTGTSLLGLPLLHGSNEDTDAPLGSGALLLAGLGAAYLMAKKRKEEE